ncbi:MAG: alkaline phosphatase family protein [Acidobacteriota bacterium]|nr:alkaline phosphatase family protein [Acidobacteriota bacterium]
MRTRLFIVAASLAATLGCGGDGSPPEKRVIVLGFDGMDYGLTRQLIDEGRLPNFARLEREGFFAPLETAVPPESPVAWSNFITGMDAGGHGIFDFVHRDPKTMFPYASDSGTSGEGFTLKLGNYQFQLTGGTYESLRKGDPFWKVLEENGIESWVLRMPANYPTSELATRELSGMGTPDLNGASFFSYYTSELFYPTEGVTGGEVFEWDVYDDMAEQKLYASENPVLIETERMATDLRVYIDRDANAAKFEVGDSVEFVLGVGEWSEWQPLEFEVLPIQTLHGAAIFYLKSIEPELEVYVSPINFDPLAPDAPVSTPPDYSIKLAEATGRFYTQGMPEDTKAFTEGVLELDQFVEQAKIAGGEIRKQYTHVLNDWVESSAGFLFYYMGNVDQFSHALWASMDPKHPAYELYDYASYPDFIPSLYEGLDEVLGQTLAAVGDETTVVVMSDHGFASWHRSFNINTWLVENGFMALKDPTLEEDPGFFMNVDWSRTRAYGMGVNGLYINLHGREKNGAVEPTERRAVMDEIAAALLETIDPKTGERAVTKVYAAEEIYRNRGSLEIGPDIQLGFTKGTRGSGKGALGDIEPEFVRDNLDDWPGDHIMDHETVPGVLFTSRPLAQKAPTIQSLATAIIAEFGIDSTFPEGD